MRKSLVFGLCFLISALLLAFLPSPAAEASGWEWRQDDWSGGPGQSNWVDNTMYDVSLGIDTMSKPGTLRLSYLSNPYTKEPSNPVLAPGVLGAWDDTEVTAFALPKEGGGYEVLYRGRNAAPASIRAVGYADSPDGITWTKYAGNPVIQGSGQPWDALGVGTGPYLKEGDTYKYWFSGYPAGPGRSFGYATSTDMVNWTREANQALSPGGPGSWDEQPQQSKVIKDGPVYHMWYLAYSAAGTGQIGHATSSDGMTFTKDPANPVLGPGAGVSWDSLSIDAFALLERPWSGDYIMAYQGTDGVTNAVGIATSPDGSTWNKDAANPKIPTGGAGTWNQNAVFPFILTYEGSIYKLNLVGIDGGGFFHAGEAYSFDGSAWNPSPYNPIISPSPAPFWDDLLTVKGYDYLEGNTLRTFYFAQGTGIGMGTATANPDYYGGPAWLDSSVFSPGTTADWGMVTWNETVPAGTTVGVDVRCGDVPIPDATWTPWTAIPNGGMIPHANSRYIQYHVNMNGTPTTTPELSNLAIDFEALPSMWYFAEGYTGYGFDQWITIQNPNAAAAAVTVTYYTPSGPPVVTNHNVPGQTRQTIYVNSDLGPDLENSCDIASTQPVIIERPMYFDYQGLGAHGWQGGHVSLGSTGLSRNWYFAEGYTGNSFEEWLTVQNPNPTWATLDVTYYVTGAAPIERQHLVAPASRYTINVNQDAGPDLELSTEVKADQPILCERPMYFAYQGYMEGGHIVMGSPYLAADWYLAEGATFPPFTEYITVQNPNAAPANLVVTYLTPGTAPIVRNHAVPPRSRYTINAGADSGQSSDLSTHVNSDQPILVERPMYFDMAYGTLPGGHAAMGVNSPATQWYFGEGYTGAGFEEWLTVQNPNAVVANLTVTYYTPTGAPIVRNHPVQPQSRYTIPVDFDAGENLEVSTYVLSDQPVICERPMYFFYQGHHAYNWPGGHDSPGFAP
jgi:predicted GH43/DUF377 family glycosyl hydrolase/P pilus assembly chaperone PapD